MGNSDIFRRAQRLKGIKGHVYDDCTVDLTYKLFHILSSRFKILVALNKT